MSGVFYLMLAMFDHALQLVLHKLKTGLFKFCIFIRRAPFRLPWHPQLPFCHVF